MNNLLTIFVHKSLSDKLLPARFAKVGCHPPTPLFSLDTPLCIHSQGFLFGFFVDVVKYILRCQCEVNVRNNQGFTPLHLAASVGTISVSQCLLEGGADVNCINTQSKVSLLSHNLQAVGLSGRAAK